MASAKTADPYAELSISDRFPCKGQPVTFTIITHNITPETYKWKLNDVVQEATGRTFTLRNNSTHYINQDDYIVCIVTDAIIKREIAAVLTGVKAYGNQVASAQISSAVPNLTFCKGQAPQFSYNIIKEDDPNLRWEFTWQVNGADVATGTGPGAVIDFPANYELHDGDKVQAKVNFSGKCIVENLNYSNELTVHVIDPASASVSISPANVNGCTGETLTFKATLRNIGGVTYRWMVNGQTVGSNSDTFESAGLIDGDKVQCTVTNSQCEAIEAQSEEVTVKLITGITNSVNISSSAKDNIIEKGQPITFTAQAAIVAGVTYQWQVNGIDVGANNPVYTTSDLNLLDRITCLVTTPGSCPEGVPIKSNEIIVYKFGAIAPPNTFTPNGDGVNDTWSIPALAGYPKCRVEIFNRYGTLVYNSVGYAKAWEGKFNGAPLPVGSYYYIIYPDVKQQKISGSVTILR
ncbi:gliding motility-associated C-terminal domain-containing protein [Mucilaginibacter pedocola]|uniref:Ig-like domain-containing protein n=1 Tax=Mucilaginibacter pedocola TaxID=1792845 RepID=A0A1S9PEW4_9SPHI|nr:gliding motility-associated C-terminal domain-containing protein [Mucilaginibacter pedocola]OOQ59484.1 hypothetical protein BC343_04700 [Mucilaginibacter pedocola]